MSTSEDSPVATFPRIPPQYIYVQSPVGMYTDEEEEIDLLELFFAVWKRKWRIFFISFFCALAAMGYSLTLPFIYKAETKITPVGGSGNSPSVSSLGALAEMAGISIQNPSTPSGMLIDLMQSNIIVDAVIDKFNLMEENEWQYKIFARKSVLQQFEAKEETKSSLITLSYKDEDPQKAVDIINTFIEETQKRLLEVSAAQLKLTREFFEKQLLEAQNKLTEAEDELIKYQQSSGVVSINEQSRALVDSISRLRTQVAEKKVQIQAMKSYARENNPQMKLAQRELQELEKQLKNLEEQQKEIDTFEGGGTFCCGSFGSWPRISTVFKKRKFC